MKIGMKRARLVALVCIAAIVIILMLGRCMPTEVAADPIVGPPTIETHLANINQNIMLIKWIGGILITLVGVISSLVVYIFMSTVGNLKSSIGYVEKKAEKALAKTDHIEENFMSLETYRLISKGKEA